MKRVFMVFILLFVLSDAICLLAQEKIISKSDADYIFTLRKPQWEEYIKRATYPTGWEVKILPLDTGSAMGAFDPKTGMGLSVQPLFSNNYSLPEMIIVGSWYPKGMIIITDEIKRGIENETKKDLGSEYDIKLTHRKEPKWDIIEILIMTSEKK